LLGVRWFGVAGSGAGKGWVAGGLGRNLGIGRLLDESGDVIGDGDGLSHGLTKPLNAFLEVVEVLVVAYEKCGDLREVDHYRRWCRRRLGIGHGRR